MTRKEKKKFHKEVGDFATTTLILGLINFWTSPGYLWFLWVIGFWGAALVGKYIQYSMDDDLDEEYDDHLELQEQDRYEEKSKNWREKDLV